MKNHFLLLLTCLLTSFSSQAQQLFFEVSSGYNLTAYDLLKYNEAEGFVPIRARLAGGLEHVQVGIEYEENITHPTFQFTDPVSNSLTADEFVNSYYGAFIRANISSLPAYRFGLVLSGGMGRYNTTFNNYDLPDEKPLAAPIVYEPMLGFNGRVGISAPIYTFLHWEIGYQFNYVKREAMPLLGLEEYDALFHSFQIGLSMNLVFGNVAKKCRRVISSGGGKRGW